MVTEQQVINDFKETLKIYPFKVRVLEEYYLELGRVDMNLQDYDTLLEFKGDKGDLNKAVGQAISYKSCGDYSVYIVLPHKKMKQQYQGICEEYDIGIIVYNENTGMFKVVNDVGGLEAFNFAQSHANFDLRKKGEGQDYRSCWLFGQGDGELIDA